MKALTFFMACFISVSVFVIASAQGLSGLYLDIGNDTDYEWNIESETSGPHRIEATEWIRKYVRGGCWCAGCKLDGDSGNCTIPVVIRADTTGVLKVDDIILNYSHTRVIGEVGYGDSFRTPGGGCWNISYNPGSPRYTGEVRVPQSIGSCPEMFTYDGDFTPLVTDSAINDAMQRLLNGTLDSDQDGICDFTDYNENYTFRHEGDIGVQTLWGPLKMRLVIWS